MSINILKEHKLRKTPFRLEILDIFLEATHSALTHQDLESKLGQYDRITLYRTLKSFEQAGIIHQVVDGSNVNKFALCHSDCAVHQTLEDHAHFLCNNCGKTFCIDEIAPLELKVPKNYKLEKVHLALSGTCAQCN